MKRFGFAQLRFLIAAVLLLAAGLKAYQLATAPLPPVIQGSMFTPLLELLNDRYFQMAVVLGEILFALVLISGLWRSWMWLLSLLGFTVFTLVSVMKGLSGEASCGCFGTVTVNPWITATFDATIVGLLFVFRERIDWNVPTLDKKKVLAVLLVWLVLAVPTTYAILSVAETDDGDLGVVFTGLDGKETFLIDPNKWIGKELPLLPYLEDSEALNRVKLGEWLVLLYHNDCDKCEKTFTDLSESQNVNVICVEIPPVSAVRKCPDSFEHARMKASRRWMADTPVVVKIEDLVVKEIVSTFSENK